jgi:hypothetical protein
VPAPTDPAAVLTAVSPDKGGAMLIDPENYKSLVALARKGEIAFQRMEQNERDGFLTRACEEGRFPVSRLEAYKGMWDKNPGATKEYVLLMPKNSVPTMTVGFLGSEVNANEADMAYEGMYGKGN